MNSVNPNPTASKTLNGADVGHFIGEITIKESSQARLNKHERLWDLLSPAAQKAFLGKSLTKEDFLKYFSPNQSSTKQSSTQAKDTCLAQYAGLGLKNNFLENLTLPKAQRLVKNVLAYRFNLDWNGQTAGDLKAATAFLDTQKVLTGKETFTDAEKLKIAQIFVGPNVSTVGEIDKSQITNKPLSCINKGETEQKILEQLGFTFSEIPDQDSRDIVSFSPYPSREEIEAREIAEQNFTLDQQIEVFYKELPKELQEKISLEQFAKALTADGIKQGKLELGFNRAVLRAIPVYSRQAFALEVAKGIFGVMDDPINQSRPSDFNIFSYIPGLKINTGLQAISNTDRAAAFVNIYKIAFPKMTDQDRRDLMLQIFTNTEPKSNTGNSGRINANQITNRLFSGNTADGQLDSLSVEAYIFRNYSKMEIIGLHEPKLLEPVTTAINDTWRTLTSKLAWIH